MVDGTPMVRDVWVDMNGDRQKQANEFRTVGVTGEREGGRSFFALDVTESLRAAVPLELAASGDQRRARRRRVLERPRPGRPAHRAHRRGGQRRRLHRAGRAGARALRRRARRRLRPQPSSAAAASGCSTRGPARTSSGSPPPTRPGPATSATRSSRSPPPRASPTPTPTASSTPWWSATPAARCGRWAWAVPASPTRRTGTTATGSPPGPSSSSRASRSGSGAPSSSARCWASSPGTCGASSSGTGDRDQIKDPNGGTCGLANLGACMRKNCSVQVQASRYRIASDSSGPHYQSGSWSYSAGATQPSASLGFDSPADKQSGSCSDVVDSQIDTQIQCGGRPAASTRPRPTATGRPGWTEAWTAPPPAAGRRAPWCPPARAGWSTRASTPSVCSTRRGPSSPPRRGRRPTTTRR